jgi:hypothetical protein
MLDRRGKERRLTLDKICALAIVGWFLLAPAVVKAQAITDGESHLKRCLTIQLTNPSAGLGCRGYIGAVAVVLAAGNAIDGFRACPPRTINREELIRTVKTWLQKNPTARSFPAFGSVSRALAEIFPCRDQ